MTSQWHWLLRHHDITYNFSGGIAKLKRWRHSWRHWHGRRREINDNITVILAMSSPRVHSSSVMIASSRQLALYVGSDCNVYISMTTAITYNRNNCTKAKKTTLLPCHHPLTQKYIYINLLVHYNVTCCRFFGEYNYASPYYHVWRHHSFGCVPAMFRQTIVLPLNCNNFIDNWDAHLKRLT